MEKCNEPFAQIPNELLDALCRIRIAGVPHMVLLAIMRQTYGWREKTKDGVWKQKTEDWIALSRFQELTGQSQSAICRAINHLLKMRIIYKNVRGGKTFYSVEGKTACWMPLPKKRRGHKIVNKDSQKSESGCSKMRYIKENVTKDTMIKDSVAEPIGSDTPEVVEPMTPKEQAIRFFGDEEVHKGAVEFFTAKGMSEALAKREVAAFVSYWTEPNGTGKKQRWQLQPTFEVKRRLVTWLSRKAAETPQRSFSTPEI